MTTPPIKNNTTTSPSEENMREAGMSIAVGAQGAGKTYKTMHVVVDYIEHKPEIGVRGGKVLIYDTNGEYTPTQFAENGLPNVNIRTIRMRDVAAWSRSDVNEIRRIDAKDLAIPDKRAHVEYIIKNCRTCLVVLEDINTYILNVTFMEKMIGSLVNLRHRALDIIVSYQSLRAIEPRMFQNSRWIRLNYQSTTSVDKIEGKLNNPELFEIAIMLVTMKYRGLGGFIKDERFFVYIVYLKNKIKGPFSRREFFTVCQKFARTSKTDVIKHMTMNDLTDIKEATDSYAKQLFDQYYGNPIV